MKYKKNSIKYIDYSTFGVNNYIGNILNDKINIGDLETMDLNDLYVLNVVNFVRKQNEQVAINIMENSK